MMNENYRVLGKIISVLNKDYPPKVSKKFTVRVMSEIDKNKINYIYLLTPSGISYKTKLTINYMKKLSNEYEALKKDLKKNEQ